MQRALARICLALAALAAVALGVALLAARIEPTLLRGIAERALSAALRAPVAIGEVRVVIGAGIVLEGRDVSVWSPASPGESPNALGYPVPDRPPELRVREVEAGVRPLRLLVGSFSLYRLTLTGAELLLERDLDGRWRTTPFSGLGDPRASAPRPALGTGEALLRPIISLEGIVHFLLAKPFVASLFEVRESSIRLSDASVPLPDGRARRLALLGFAGRVHHRGSEGAELFAKGRLFDGEQHVASLEWTGSGDPSGGLRSALSSPSVKMSVAEPYLRRYNPEIRLIGSLEGALRFESGDRRRGRVRLDAKLREWKASWLPPHLTALGPVASSAADLVVALDVSPVAVQLEEATLTSGSVDLRLSGSIERPLGIDSDARLSVSLRNLQLARVIERFGWLPHLGSEGSADDNVEAGRLTRLSARGEAPITRWQAFFAGRTESLPKGFEVESELVGGRVRIGEGDLLEKLEGRITWSGERVEVAGARAELNGRRLPTVDLQIDGVSHLFATRPVDRRINREDAPIPGLRPFLEMFRGEETAHTRELQTRVELELDDLQHPVLLWPIADAHVIVEPSETGVDVEISRASWAGAAIRGRGGVTLGPEMRIWARLTAAPQPSANVGSAAIAEAESRQPPETELPASAWMRGRFWLGATSAGNVELRKAFGRLLADGARIDLWDIDAELLPAGRLIAKGNLDFSHPDRVPVDLELSMSEGDMEAVTGWFGLPSGEATGRVDFWGRLAGELRPGDGFADHLTGQVGVSATDGKLRRGIPPVVAVALANDGANPFAGRDHVRYSRIATTFDLTDHWMRADSFLLDGPDLRLFASGKVRLAEEPHDIEAEVAIFLFRQVDQALGGIPLVSQLLLGDDESLASAHYRVSGTWEEPSIDLVPARTLASGAGLVFEGVPEFLRRAAESVGGFLGREPATPPRLRNLGPARP